MKTFARRIGATVGGLLVLLAFVPPVQADSSITIFPPIAKVQEDSTRVAATIMNTGDETYVVTAESGVRWATPSPESFRLEPGQQQIVQIALKPNHPQRDAEVVFSIPPPEGSGLTVSGAVALQLDAFPYEVFQAPVETPAPQVVWWPWAAVAGVLIVAWIWRRRRKSHRELVKLANKSYGF